MLYIHKLQIRTCVSKECYDDIKDIMPAPINGAKTHEQRIGQPQHTPNVKYVISPNGTIMIYISCSDNPFRLQHEEDISAIMVFLGRVEDRLRLLFPDTRDEIVQPVNKWILKACDVNKDMEIDGLAQLTLPDIQIPLFEKALRAYVKPIKEKVFYRVELGLTPNKPVEEALKKLRTDVVIDEGVFIL